MTHAPSYVHNSRAAARLGFLAGVLLLCALSPLTGAKRAAAQSGKKIVSPPAPRAAKPPLLVRTTAKHETRRLGYGGTVTLLGAPDGSITIEAWPRDEVDITAEIELRAETEEDLARLSTLNGFALDEDANHLRILTTGTHDKQFMRRAAGRDFPKKLLGLPWKLHYRLRVPAMTDLEINAGRGAFALAGVEGAISFRALESDAIVALAGGGVALTVGRGTINFRQTARSWRGPGAVLQLAAGTLSVELPPNFSGDLNADVLRTGRIENNYAELAARDRTTPDARSLRARGGAGGATHSFTVGDGTLRITRRTEADAAN